MTIEGQAREGRVAIGWSRIKPLGRAALLTLTLLAAMVAGSAEHDTRPFTPSEDLVLQAYLAYYGRPGDPAGLAYWAERLDAEGGNLDAIMQAFGDSAEFRERYAHLSNEALVTGLYRQLFARAPDDAGLAFYVGWLDNEIATLQSIALDVMAGALNEDAIVADHRLQVARHSVSRLEAHHGPEPDISADELAALIADVTVAPATLDEALNAVDMLIDSLPTYQRVLQVTKQDDTADGHCDADCSLREALMIANREPGLDLIEIPAGVFTLVLNGASESSDAYRDLEVLEAVHLSGAGREETILDGNGWTRVLEVRPQVVGAGAMLSDLTLTGGFHAFGGAVLNDGVLTLRRVAIEGNTGFNGGGLLNTASLSLSDSQIIANQAIPDAGATGFGGGIWNAETGSIEIRNSIIESNNAHHSGAGLYSTGALIIGSSRIADNAAGGVGGGIFSLGDLALDNSALEGNAANDGGGFAIQDGGVAILRDCSISDNQATGLDLGGGGGAFNYQGELTIERCTLSGNLAYGEGGGAIETNGPLVVRESVIENNHAHGHDASQLPDDTAPGLGGGLLTIAGSEILIESTRFTGNRAGTSGGAIYNDRSTALTLTDVELHDNHAEGYYGGAIANEGNFDVWGGSITDNSAPGHGGAITTNIGAVQIHSARVSGNTSGNGGALGNYLGGRLTLVDTELVDNTATGGLGGAIINDAASTVTIEGGRIANNRAHSSGGGLYNVAGATLTLNNVLLESNQVDGVNGGGLTNEGTATIIGGAIQNNQSPQQAGGIICNSGTLMLQDTLVSGNVSANGGGISNANGCTLTLERTLVEENSALTGFGGGLLNDHSRILIIESTISGNSAVYGGGLSNNAADGTIELDRTTVRDNVADEGSAFANFGTLVIRASLIEGTCNNQSEILDQGNNTILCALPMTTDHSN